MNKLSEKHQKIFTATLLVLLITVASFFAIDTVQQAQAQVTGGSTTVTGDTEFTPLPTAPPAGVTPDQIIDTIAYLSCSPGVVGVNQDVLVNIWATPPINVNLLHTGYTVKITKPDGTTDTVGPMNCYMGDSTAWFTYKVTQNGTWQFQFFFAGNYYEAGTWSKGILTTNGTGTNLVSTYFKPASSPIVNVTVINEQVASWPPATLPNDYWTRPIQPNNREWWVIGGNYPWTQIGGGAYWPEDTNAYASNYHFTPYVQGPACPHVVWMEQETLDGIFGGYTGDLSAPNMPDGKTETWGLPAAGNPSIVFQGRCYMTLTKPMPQLVNGAYQTVPTTVWECRDLRTGEVIWDLTGITQPPTAINYGYGNPNVPGAVSRADLLSASLVYVGSSRMIKYNPFSGAVTLNVSLPVSSGTIYGDPFVLSVQTIGSGANAQYRLINWTMAGTTTNFADRIMSNTSFPFSSIGTADFEAGITVSARALTNPGTGADYGSQIMAARLTTGDLLWNITTTDTIFSTSTGVADHGMYAVAMMNNYWDAFDLTTGKQVWKSDVMSYPWGWAWSYEVESAYGMIFDQSYSGLVAFDWETGKVVWTFVAPAPPFETPYTTNGVNQYSFEGAEIADGKIYAFTCEHSPSAPLTRGWKLYCINATSGDYMWSILGDMAPGPIADGYLTAGNFYDGYLYAFGKGLSTTTVSAPQTAVTSGTNMVISGTVLDQSPAQPGAACVSDDSMGTYMEYLHMQQPIDGIYHNVTIVGVPVSIDTIDPSGTPIHIETVTSDVSGTFSYTWTPTTPGDYKITATFPGSGGYGSSWAETHVNVVEAPVTPTQPAISFDTINSTVTTTIIAGVIAIIIAVAVIGALILRKRP
jgi:hypothetical protein